MKYRLYYLKQAWRYYKVSVLYLWRAIKENG